MTKETLRKLYDLLQKTPRYSITANTISEEAARDICNLFLYSFEDSDIQENFRYANKYSQRRIDITSSEGRNMFHDATRLFFGYLYDIAYENAMDDEQFHSHHD